MAGLLRWLRIPRPTKFLYFMTLRTGVEMIALSMLFNRVAGFYGLVAILTGFRLDAAQLSMYLYSIMALILIALLMPHIRKQSPLECLALAWFYAFDTAVNCAYTAAFAVTWFLTLRTSDLGPQGSVASGAPGDATMNDTAGLISSINNVSEADTVVSRSGDLVGGQDAVAAGKAMTATAVTISTGLQHIPSLFIIVFLTLVRLYFVLVVMAFAREVLRQYLHSTSSTRSHIVNDGSSDVEAENPFGPNMPLGQGWRGKLGRILVYIGRGYFLDGPVDDGWARGVSSRFKPSKSPILGDQRGTFERERRARSGTGPPLPPPNLKKLGKLDT